ncbi:MAG: serine/threonine-protein kinase, partial [Candidatus Nanoarchaeia archaeon]
EKKESETEGKRLKIACFKCGQKLDLTEMEAFSKVNCPSCSTELIVPKWFDNYLLEEPGGEGGMATVYRALDLTLDREVAIKILNPSIASESERTKLFLHEARTSATLNHFAIIPIYTCGEYQGQPYIVMQYMNGGSLDKKLEQANGKLPINDVIKWIIDVAEGLDNARRHGIIHHDIKPANIMLDTDGNAKIGDFGIAQALRDVRAKEIDELTKQWSSPHFVSPEKISEGKEDFHGDVYSLGATFYNLITGKLPFDIEDVRELLRYKLNNDPADPRKYRPEIPEGIAHLILAMMARTPELRPTYRDIINTLSPFLKKAQSASPGASGRKQKGKPSQQKSSMQSRFVAGEVKPRTAGQIIQPTKSSTGLNKFLIAAIILIVAGGGWFFYNGKNFNLKPENGSFSGPIKDFNPEITEMLRSGNCRSAKTAAQKALSNISLPLEARLQAGVQLAFAIYLCNEPSAKNDCALIVEQLKAAGASDSNPLLGVIQFLSSPIATEEALLAKVGENAELKQLAWTAVFLKNLFDKQRGINIVNPMRNLTALSTTNSVSFWGNAWKERLRLWQDWTNYGSGNSDALESLIAANKYDSKIVVASANENETKIIVKRKENDPWAEFIDTKRLNDIDVESLSPEWLKKNRKFAENRPRPANYSFNDKEVSEYLSSLEEDIAGAEKNRLIQVSNIKQNICSWMMRTHFEDNEILLKNGTKLQGTVMGNPKFISVRSKHGEHKRLGWEELDFKEIVKIMKYYTDMRLNAYGGPVVDATQQKYECAMDYLRIALLCDWYGYYPEAVEFANKALNTDSRISGEIKKYLMYGKT